MGKKIGILGSGPVARTLAEGFMKYGYEVMMGTREPEILEDWKSKTGDKAHVGSFADAAEFAPIVVLAVKGAAAEEVVKLAVPEHLSGRIIIDTTNPIADTPPENGVLRFFTSLDESLMERLQHLAPEARFVKSFNSVGHSLMVNPKFDKTKPTMFICGNDAEAKSEVTKILEMFGWEAADMGGVESARVIEPLCILWCIPGILRGEWGHAFKLLKK